MASDRPQRPHSEGDEDAITTEATPLLASATSPIVPAGGDIEDAKTLVSTPTSTTAFFSSSASSSRPGYGSTSSQPPSQLAGSREADEDIPLPKRQIFFLCVARLIEPIAFFSIFPYINKMVLDNGDIEEQDMGFYSGLIESLFSLTQMVVMVGWGRAADRIGRKPVLVSSLLGLALATSCFGLAKSIWQMVVIRCAAGVFAGTIVTIRTMIAEHSTRKTQARSFAWFAVAGNLGIFLGPLIGGALADPAGQYPGVFKGIWFFEYYPYALSSLVVGVIGLVATLTSALFVEETLHRNVKSTNDDETGTTPPRPRASTWDLLTAPGVGIVLYNYGHVMLLAFAYTAIVPVFWATRVSLGGLGFSPLRISLFMGLTGLAQAIWLLAFFPPLQRRYGTNGVLRVCGVGYPFFMGFMPVLNAVLRADTRGGVVAFWIIAPILLSLGPGVSMAFTGVQLALNDVSPSPETLGMLNALALTLTSGLRSFSPALFASLFAVGAGSQFFYGYFVWVILVILALGFTLSTRFLPEASEKQPENDRHTDQAGQDHDSDITARD
ncbi:major facilitator superfamily transporter [Nemania sp. FL0916]|nr:major facilitator superfamily transporter [Nemania sp. FL0916]